MILAKSHTRALVLPLAGLMTASLAAAQVTPPQRPSAAAVTPSLSPLINSVKDAVVNVEVTSRQEAQTLQRFDLGEDFFERFFGRPFGGDGPPLPFRPAPEGDLLRRGIGSGVLIDSKGLILTNHHVVRSADNIRVTLHDGRQFDARVLGGDPLTDLALIRVKQDASGLPYARLGNSDAMEVGDWVVAIGNPLGLASSVSAGIISARARNINIGPYDDFLQTDAAINPGNSGGPLFNLSGEVIGINTAIAGQGTGIGFAIPSNMAKALLPQLEKGEVRRGWLGVMIQDLTPELAKALDAPVTKGALVSSVEEDTPAARAGLRSEDVITALDGAPVESSSGLTRAIGARQPGARVTVTLFRDGKKLERPVTLGTRPDLEARQKEGSGPQERRLEELGLQFQDIDARTAQARGVPAKGALITRVVPGSRADRAGLTAGMLIVEAGSKPISRAGDLEQALQQAKPGSALLLRVQVPDGQLLKALEIP
jgi:serine protease Do